MDPYEHEDPKDFCGYCGTRLDEDGSCPADPGADNEEVENEEPCELCGLTVCPGNMPCKDDDGSKDWD